MKNKISLAILLFLSSCSLSKLNVVKKRRAQFGVDLLKDVWEKKRFRGADLFFEHKIKDANIYLHSQCSSFKDSPLEALTSQLLVGMGNYEIVSQKKIELAQRKALVSEINTELDGVYRYLKVLVLRKNACVFDAILSSKTYDSVIVKDFDLMTKSFWAKADL